MNHFIAPDGTRLAYEVDGPSDGLPLLCLSGLSRNARDFDDFAAAVSAQDDGLPLRLIRMDYRGRGASDHADPASYTVPTEAGDTIALLEHLSIDRAAILGTSRGGLIAMTLAALHKDRLSGVILNDIGPELGAGGLAHIGSYLGTPPAAANYDETAALLAKNNASAFRGVPLEKWRLCAERWFEEAPGGGMALRYDPRLAEVAKPNPDVPLPDLWPLFDALSDLPLGLIRGANSNLLETPTVAQMCRRRPDMAYAEVPDRGHVPFLDEPEALTVIKKVLSLI